MYHYSIIIPVYNRPDEVDELLQSLVDQSYKDFDLIIVEDGSTKDCRSVVSAYQSRLDIAYYFKENSGPGASRNFGMQKAKGDYLVFFDSDCVIPSEYLLKVDQYLQSDPLDCYGGPDAAHASFSDVQKAINQVMTSFITTGGVRGNQKQIDRYQPRSFNMGIKKQVYDNIGGFSDLHPGEDPDLSYRIMQAGYTTGLISEAYVYHKRRIDFKKFATQVYKFGVVRNILFKWHPKYKSPVYAIPSLFLVATVLLIFASIIMRSWLYLLPIIFVGAAVFVESLFKTKSLWIAAMSVRAAYTQLYAYGYGFLKSFWILMIRNKNERQALPDFFF